MAWPWPRDGRLLIADALSIADMSADATVTRRLNLLIDLPGLAAGVCPSGDDLLVATHTDVLRYPRGSGPPSVVVARLEGVSSIVADGMAGRSSSSARADGCSRWAETAPSGS